MAKPDDRSDNVERLQEHVQNTQKNLHEAEDYLAEHAEELSPDEKRAIKTKNEHRRESLAGMRSEIRDEAAHRNRNM